VIDSVLNLLFRCSHRHLTRPLTRVGIAGVRQSESYVVCLDCGKQFVYDLEQMRIGKVIDRSHAASVVPEKAPVAPKTKLKIAVWAAVPLAAAIGAKLHFGKSRRTENSVPGRATPRPG
jgi:hypothetical protein